LNNGPERRAPWIAQSDEGEVDLASGCSIVIIHGVRPSVRLTNSFNVNIQPCCQEATGRGVQERAGAPPAMLLSR